MRILTNGTAPGHGRAEHQESGMKIVEMTIARKSKDGTVTREDRIRHLETVSEARRLKRRLDDVVQFSRALIEVYVPAERKILKLLELANNING